MLSCCRTHLRNVVLLQVTHLRNVDLLQVTYLRNVVLLQASCQSQVSEDSLIRCTQQATGGHQCLLHSTRRVVQPVTQLINSYSHTVVEEQHIKNTAVASYFLQVSFKGGVCEHSEHLCSPIRKRN